MQNIQQSHLFVRQLPKNYPEQRRTALKIGAVIFAILLCCIFLAGLHVRIIFDEVLTGSPLTR
jgi:Na+/pantothenate symporter